jgi:hypothetical protein
VENDFVAYFKPRRGTQKYFPEIAFDFAQQQRFHFPASRFAPKHPRAQNTRIVQDEQIIVTQQIWQISHTVMRDHLRQGRIGLHMHQTRAVTRFGGMLGDVFWRKAIIKFANEHFYKV